MLAASAVVWRRAGLPLASSPRRCDTLPLTCTKRNSYPWVAPCNAATKVKTLTQLLGTMRESAGSGWAQTWQIIFGDFDEARNLFTSVNDTLGGFIKNSADNRNELLQTWKDLGGRDVLIDSIGNSFEALLAVLKPIREGFREIFPKATAVGLYNITYAIRSFTETLKIGGENADKLRRTFAGLFAIFGIGWDAVKAAATVLARLLGI